MLSEIDLIKGCKEFNIKAQQELYDRFSRKMYVVCYYYTGSADDAKDVLHEGFLKIFSKIGQFRGEGSFEGWIRRLMVNTANDFIKNKNNRLDLVTDYFDEDTEDIRENIEDENENEVDFTKDEIFEVINKLPDELRIIFNLFCLERYSHKEISALLLISENTCRSKLRRARNMLRNYLENLQKNKISNHRNF